MDETPDDSSDEQRDIVTNVDVKTSTAGNSASESDISLKRIAATTKNQDERPKKSHRCNANECDKENGDNASSFCADTSNVAASINVSSAPGGTGDDSKPVPSTKITWQKRDYNLSEPILYSSFEDCLKRLSSKVGIPEAIKNAVCDDEKSKLVQLQILLEHFVRAHYDLMRNGCRKWEPKNLTSTKRLAGVYLVVYRNGTVKFGMSFDCYKRVQSQSHSFAAMVMDLRDMEDIVLLELITQINNLGLPGLSYHEDQVERLDNLLKMQLCDMCLACTYECVTAAVGERLVQQPSTQVQEAIAPCTFTNEAIDFMRNIPKKGCVAYSVGPRFLFDCTSENILAKNLSASCWWPMASRRRRHWSDGGYVPVLQQCQELRHRLARMIKMTTRTMSRRKAEKKKKKRLHKPRPPRLNRRLPGRRLYPPFFMDLLEQATRIRYREFGHKIVFWNDLTKLFNQLLGRERARLGVDMVQFVNNSNSVYKYIAEDYRTAVGRVLVQCDKNKRHWKCDGECVAKKPAKQKSVLFVEVVRLLYEDVKSQN